MSTPTTISSASEWKLKLRSHWPPAISTTRSTIGVRVVIKGGSSATPSPSPNWNSLAWTRQRSFVGIKMRWP
eukprot:5824611-Pyramimonas_sp.AAC.1